ncbi:hypothetical protein [Nocardioides sp.]|uniref:hypothetical protein n=1 Tax=Nocardioides sp. TaxID=35761 RepID=UPI003D0967F6
MSTSQSERATNEVKKAERRILELMAEIEQVRSGKKGIRGKRARLNMQLSIAYKIGRRSKSKVDWKRAFANICKRQKIGSSRTLAGAFTRLVKLVFADETPTSRIRYAKVLSFANRSKWSDKQFRSALADHGLTKIEQDEINRKKVAKNRGRSD